MTKETKKYPFNDGQSYWTIGSCNYGQDLKVVHSFWDDISEQIHDENPDRLLFATEQEAIDYLSKKKLTLKRPKEYDINLFTCVDFGDVCHWDYPDYCDAFIEEAEYDGKELSEEELDEVNEDSELVHELLMKHLH